MFFNDTFSSLNDIKPHFVLKKVKKTSTKCIFLTKRKYSVIFSRPNKTPIKCKKKWIKSKNDYI